MSWWNDISVPVAAEIELVCPFTSLPSTIATINLNRIEFELVTSIQRFCLSLSRRLPSVDGPMLA
jgi:hypothetical protein